MRTGFSIRKVRLTHRGLLRRLSAPDMTRERSHAVVISHCEVIAVRENKEFNNRSPIRVGRQWRLVYISFLLLALPHVAAAQSFTVSGNTGQRWVDTGLDLKPGALVRLDAKGTVDVGAGWGEFGPEGTEKFADVPGYPAETPLRYGLAARLTQSRTDPFDDLREQWAYGEKREHCASNGGRLWLTVNDDQPKDNTGAFLVEVTLGICRLEPTGRERRAGNFRITLNGFSVQQQTQDGDMDGRGDEVYVVADVYVMNMGGEILNRRRITSVVMGDPNGGVGRQPAGSAQPGPLDLRDAGGLINGDSFPASRPWRRTTLPLNDRIPLLLWEGELAEDDKVIAIVPTLWEWDGNERLLRDYTRETQDSLASIQSAVKDHVSGGSGSAGPPPLLPPAHYFDSAYGSWLRNRPGLTVRGDFSGDRPIGGWYYMRVDEAAAERGWGQVMTRYFAPHALAFSYRIAQETIGNVYNGTPGAFALPLTESVERRWEADITHMNLGARYTMFIQVERLDRPSDSPGANQ